MDRFNLDTWEIGFGVKVDVEEVVSLDFEPQVKVGLSCLLL